MQFKTIGMVLLLGAFLAETGRVADLQGTVSSPLTGTFSGGLSVIWARSQEPQTLKKFSESELRQLKPSTSREKDPRTGQVTEWSGTLLSTVLETAMGGLDPASKAQIDLVVLTGAGGVQAVIPRAFLGKYPILLSWRGGSAAGLRSVVPWTSRPRILKEGIPLESLFLNQVAKVELTSYQVRFGKYFLRKRTDPAAMRGERHFVQSCVSCHQGGAPALKTQGHPAVRGFQLPDDRTRRALESYFTAFRTQD